MGAKVPKGKYQEGGDYESESAADETKGYDDALFKVDTSMHKVCLDTGVLTTWKTKLKAQ